VNLYQNAPKMVQQEEKQSYQEHEMSYGYFRARSNVSKNRLAARAGAAGRRT
jgi:hypothetical protein